MGIHIADQLGIVSVPPVFGWVLPGHLALDLHAVQLLVKYDILELWVVLEDERDVVEVVFQNCRAGFVLETLLPVGILAAGEIRLGIRHPFACRQQLYLILLHGELAHRLVRRFFVQISKAVDTDDVKGVAQLEVSRVFGMVAVDELVLLDLYARHAGGCDQVPAVLIVGRLIDIGEKCLQRLADGIIGAVEQTHHALFGQRVLHLLLCGGIRFAFSGRGGQSCGVSPFRVLCENRIGVEPTTVCLLIHKGAVSRRGRPVHQLIGLVGTFVEIVDAQHLSQIAGHRHKFLRGHIPGQREHQPDAGIFFRAAVSGVQCGGIRAERFIVIQKSGVDAVAVKRHHRAAFHGIDLAPAALQHARNKAAVVFGSVTLGAAHLRIFLGGLGGADGHFEPFLQIVKSYSLVDPSLCLPVIAVGDVQFTHSRLPPRSSK